MKKRYNSIKGVLCRSIFFLLFIVLCAGVSSCIGKKAQNVKKIFCNGATLYVEVADEEDERTKGLQKRKWLLPNWGMLFVYEDDRYLRFWMKNTSIPLDLAFLDSNGRILEIREMKPHDTSIITSKQPSRYAIEVNQGWFEQKEITIGEKFTHLPQRQEGA